MIITIWNPKQIRKERINHEVASDEKKWSQDLDVVVKVFINRRPRRFDVHIMVLVVFIGFGKGSFLKLKNNKYYESV